MHQTSRLRLALILASLLVLSAAGPAFAAESRDLDDGITITVGFITEPPIQQDTNGLRIAVTQGDKPLNGLEDTLKATVKLGDETRDLPLTPAPGEDGVYESVFIPATPGSYEFTISGKIADQELDETFKPGENGVPVVASRLDYEFPTAANGSAKPNVAWAAVVGSVVIAAGGLVRSRLFRRA